MNLSRTQTPTILCVLRVMVDGAPIDAWRVRALDTEAGWVEALTSPPVVIDGIPITQRLHGVVTMAWTHRVELGDGLVAELDEAVTYEDAMAFLRLQGEGEG